jgi:competence protein ComEA
MQTMTRATLAVIVFSLAFTAGAGASTSPPRPQAAPPPTSGAAQDVFPETTGKAALMRVCSNCHTAENVIQTLRTRQEWSDVIDQMSRFGAEASDQEFEQILTYLATHFSPIKINKAAAKELQATLDIPLNVAEAIIAYRTEKGEFKTLDDLKSVPGLDSARIEARKGRIVF